MSDHRDAARALERVLLRSGDLRLLLAQLRELTTPRPPVPLDQAPALWNEAERLVAELEELGRAGRVPERPAHE